MRRVSSNNDATLFGGSPQGLGIQEVIAKQLIGRYLGPCRSGTQDAHLPIL
jgi:hypothetical protein